MLSSTILDQTIYKKILCTIAHTKGSVSFAEGTENSIVPKAVTLHWPVLPGPWRSVEIPIGICTARTLTALLG